MKQILPRNRIGVSIALGLIVLLILAALIVRYRYLALSQLSLNLPNQDAAAVLKLKQIADIPLHGGTSRFDYQSIDDSRNLLYISHLGAGQLTVFDLKAQEIVTDISDLAGAHGVVAVPALGRIFVSATDSRQVAVIDPDTNRIIARVDAGQYPDGLAYDPDTHKLFVSDESGGGDIVIDAQSSQRIGRIDLGGQVGNTQYDPVGHQILAAAQGLGQLVEIDPKTEQVTIHINLPGCDGPHGFYLDAASRRVFMSCEGNATLMVVDLNSARVTATDTVGDVPDVLAFDSGLQRLYVATESGVVAVFDTSATGLLKIGQTYLAPGAHTVAVDPQSHRVYFPLENINGQPVLRIFEPAP